MGAPLWTRDAPVLCLVSSAHLALGEFYPITSVSFQVVVVNYSREDDGIESRQSELIPGDRFSSRIDLAAHELVNDVPYRTPPPSNIWIAAL